MIPASFLGFVKLRVPHATQCEQCIDPIVAGDPRVSYTAGYRVAPAYRGGCGISLSYFAERALALNG